jgi:hypothetical protein
VTFRFSWAHGYKIEPRRTIGNCLPAKIFIAF